MGWGDEVKEGGHVYTFLGTSVGQSWEIGDELVDLILQIKARQTFPIKDKIVNISGLVGRVWSLSQLLSSAVVV